MKLGAVAVQVFDDVGSDRAMARYVSYGVTPCFSAGQFGIVECQVSKRRYLAQSAGANLNFNRNSLAAFDNTAINQLEMIYAGEMDRDVAIREYFFYELQLLKEIIDERPQSVRVRPQIGAMARAASREEIVRYLGLPVIDERTQIGTIIDTDVPICTALANAMLHTLVAGSPGSGKTNTIANYIAAMLASNCCVIILDHKPDYQHVHYANADAPLEPYFRGLKEVDYWYIGSPFPVDGRSENPISVPACELDPEMLSTTIFYRDGEENQREACLRILYAYISKYNGRQWSMQDFREYVVKAPEIKAMEINKSTLDAVKDKIQRPNRIPKWIDAKVPTMLTASAPKFRIGSLIGPGHAVVIRVSSEASDGREYGLLLSRVLDDVNGLAEKRKLPCPVVIVIDEAQDIFCATRLFRQITSEMLDKHIRKGRSKRIGYIIGVQAADFVPDSILNYLNNRVIHRHNNYEQIRVAANMATDDQRRMSNTFGPGEALVSLFGASSVVHAQMRRSAFMLTKEEL